MSTTSLARYNVRTLLPGPEEALRDAVTRVGAPPDSLMLLARHAVVEAIAVDGLRDDEIRVIERHVTKGGGIVMGDPRADRILILAPLSVVGELAAHLHNWGQATESVAAAIETALTGRGAAPTPMPLGETVVELGERTPMIVADDAVATLDLDVAPLALCIDVAAVAATQAAFMAGAAIVRVDAAAVPPGLWSWMAATTGGVILACHDDALDDADLTSMFGLALSEAAAAGMRTSRVWVEVETGTTGAAHRRLQRLGQLRGLGAAVLANVERAPTESQPATAVVARLRGADVIRCSRETAAAVRAALDVADAVRHG